MWSIPAAANHRLRVLRLMLAEAMALKWRPDDPSREVDRLAQRSKGYHSWTEAEIAQYEARWPSGSQPRRALALLLYTAQRRSDVVRMGRQHVAGGWIKVRQQKTQHTLEIPLHPDLVAEIAHVPAGQMTFLQSEYGAAFTANGFYMRFRNWCEEAGLPAGRSPHGLRKACGRRLAEAGATAHQIMSILGLRTLSEAERYTRAAESRRMAAAGMAKLSKLSNRNRLSGKFAKSGG